MKRLLSGRECQMGVKFKVLNRSIPREDDIRDELRGVQSTVEFLSVNDILRHFLPSSVEVDGETPSLVTSRELNSVAVHVSCVVMLRKQQVDKVLGTVVECIQLEVQSLYPFYGIEGKLPGM